MSGPSAVCALTESPMCRGPSEAVLLRSEQRESPALMALKGKEIPPRALIYIWRQHVTQGRAFTNPTTA